MSQHAGISTLDVPVCCGVDLGYGNAKTVWLSPSNDGGMEHVILPVGAARSSQAMKRLGGQGLAIGDGELVTIAGEEWVAGVDPLNLQRFARPTHENYTTTNEYLALFYAVLAKIGATHISRLVTGLPVSQIYGPQPTPSFQQRLKQRLSGAHSVSPSLVVTIDEVIVVPQPAGAFRARLAADRTFATDKHALSMVVDIGYYSTDWALMRGVAVQDEQSGSSTEATSRILEQARDQIRATYPDVELSDSRIESAFRDGQDSIKAGQYTIEITHFITAAARKVCEDVVNAIQKKRRGSDESINTILVTGGGASLIAPFLKNAFRGAEVIESEQSVIANATGFCLIARDNYLNAMKQKRTA